MLVNIWKNTLKNSVDFDEYLKFREKKKILLQAIAHLDSKFKLDHTKQIIFT